MIELPKIGEVITTERAIELCNHYKFHRISKIFTNYPEKFKSWVFDGCSCVKDSWLGILTTKNWRDITYKCCLPHDLQYAYGQLDHKKLRKYVDIIFENDLRDKAGVSKFKARLFYYAVRIGGKSIFKSSFSWGFARK